MQRIATTNKAPDLFGAGKDGFRDGNPSGGVYATEFSALWCNQAQEELLTLIEAAGLTPSDTDNTQIWQALVALYGAGRPGHAFAANDWVPGPAGLLIQWGQIGSVGTAGADATFPIAFPNNAFITVPYVSVSSGPVTQFVNSIQTATPKSTIRFALNTGSAAVGYIALGN